MPPAEASNFTRPGLATGPYSFELDLLISIEELESWLVNWVFEDPIHHSCSNFFIFFFRSLVHLFLRLKLTICPIAVIDNEAQVFLVNFQSLLNIVGVADHLVQVGFCDSQHSRKLLDFGDFDVKDGLTTFQFKHCLEWLKDHQLVIFCVAREATQQDMACACTK